MPSPPFSGPGDPGGLSPPLLLPPPTLTLNDLNDNVLGLITSAAYAAGGHSGLFSASRLLAAGSPASLSTRVVARPRSLDTIAAGARCV